MTTFRYLVAGFFMGLAELLPGISGSTIALLFRVYEHIVISAKAITSLGFWKNPIQEIKKYEFYKIFLLIFTMGLGVALFSKLIVFIFENYTEVFNLLIAISMILIAIFIYLREQSKIYSVQSLMPLAVGLLVGFLLEKLNITETEISIITLFIAGIIAFSFFIVPGISGSAILVSLGLYEMIIKAIATIDLAILLPFGFGCLISLIILPRIILKIYFNNKVELNNFFAGLIFISGIFLF